MGATTSTIEFGASGYPSRLGRLLDAPNTLRVRGTIAPAPVAVAIVGSRSASRPGRDAAHELAAAVARDGGSIISGGAVGIDAAAHRGALHASGHTVAVVGGGLDHLYPAANRPLFAGIVRAGGAVTSPFSDSTPPRPWTFVRRNRVIAGLADIVVVAEANSASGALHTARAARDYGRPVGAVPGSPGCEALIAQGAAAIECPDDLWSALDGRPRRPEISLPFDGSDAALVLSALSNAPVGVDELVEQLGLDGRAITSALTELELDGLAVLVPGSRYVASYTAAVVSAR